MTPPFVPGTPRPTIDRPACDDCAEWLVERLMSVFGTPRPDARRLAYEHSRKVKLNGSWWCKRCDTLEFTETVEEEDDTGELVQRLKTKTLIFEEVYPNRAHRRAGEREARKETKSALRIASGQAAKAAAKAVGNGGATKDEERAD